MDLREGLPGGQSRTHPSVQTRIRFSRAVFDIVAYRSEDTAVQLALALPGFPCYRTLAERVRWLLPVVPFRILWGAEDGATDE